MSKKTIAKSMLRELPWMKLSETKKNFLEKICNKIINDELIEVVWCKDCVNYHNSGEANGIGWCDMHSRIDALGEWDMWDENDFCSCGERKEK